MQCGVVHQGPVHAPHRPFGREPFEEQVDRRADLVVVRNRGVDGRDRGSDLVRQSPSGGEAHAGRCHRPLLGFARHDAQVLLHQKGGCVHRMQCRFRLGGARRVMGRKVRHDLGQQFIGGFVARRHRAQHLVAIGRQQLPFVGDLGIGVLIDQQPVGQIQSAQPERDSVSAPVDRGRRIETAGTSTTRHA